MKVVDMLLNKGLTGKPLGKVNGVVIHWFASPMAKAKNVIKYWEGQANGVNAHDVICLDGTTYHAVPYSMMAYQVGCPRGYSKEAVRKLSSYPNRNVVGIECAHKDMTGKMTEETYKALVEQSAYLLKKFNLSTDDLWLHSEIVGRDYKDCHRWFTTTKPSDWNKLKKDVAELLDGKVTIKPETISQVDVDSDILDYGDKGSEVKTLQENLNKLGYSVGKADGAFGKLTDSAVKKFQKDKGLVADGLAGQKTLAAIEKAIGDLNNKKETTASTYIVKKGDTLWSIAAKNGMAVKELENLNKGKDISPLQVGTKLTLKTGASKVTTESKKPASPTSTAPKVDELKYSRTLKQGMSGNDVKELQTALNKLKFNSGTPDGKYGAKTKDAVRRYQSVYLALEVDGIAGKRTINSINKQLNK